MGNSVAVFKKHLNIKSAESDNGSIETVDSSVMVLSESKTEEVIEKEVIESEDTEEEDIESVESVIVISRKSYATADPGIKYIIHGVDCLWSPELYKGLAFTLEERQFLSIHGLLPPSIKSPEEQMTRCRINLDLMTDVLNKYCYLTELQDLNERLFYRFFIENLQKVLPLVYTPTVGLACQKYGLIYKKTRGLFITIYDRGHIFDVLKNWPENDVRAICVTDGGKILGLGDLGAFGMGIPVGKLSLYTAMAHIKPHQCLPISLDVGTDTKTLQKDPTYFGICHKRIQGPKYDEFIQEFLEAIVQRFGHNTLIHCEDFGNVNAFNILTKYREHYCMFNDDIQGSGAIGVAGLLTSLRITRSNLSDHTLLFFGAGQAALGIAELCVMAMVKEGTSDRNARNKIWLIDSKGLVVRNRSSVKVSIHKLPFAKNQPHMKNLLEIVQKVKPTVIIGVSAVGGAFTPAVLQEMAKNSDHPIVFALSNPTIKAECTAEQAYINTDGKCLFASGSPFPPVTYKGKTYTPSQGNNCYIFPGIALGVICAGMLNISDDVFLLASSVLADMVTKQDLDNGSLYPTLNSAPECAFKIAVQVVEFAYEFDLATIHPKPDDLEAYVKAQLYDFNYTSALPRYYSWPHF